MSIKRVVAVLLPVVFACHPASCEIDWSEYKPQIKNVSAWQRCCPWDSYVDVVYTLSGIVPSGSSVSLIVDDRVSAKRLYDNYKNDAATSGGRHQIIRRLDFAQCGIDTSTVRVWIVLRDSLDRVVAFDYTDVFTTNSYDDTAITNDLYCVIDLSRGLDSSKWHVSHMPSVPADGWSYEFKTGRIVMRRVNGRDGKHYYLGGYEPKHGEAPTKSMLEDFIKEGTWRYPTEDQLAYALKPDEKANGLLRPLPVDPHNRRVECFCWDGELDRYVNTKDAFIESHEPILKPTDKAIMYGMLWRIGLYSTPWIWSAKDGPSQWITKIANMMGNRKLVSGFFLPYLRLRAENAKYLVIDLTAGPDAETYPVMTMEDAPTSGWTDEYKTSKLVLRRCTAGKDAGGGRYTLTKDFYAGVFPVTERQWHLVMGHPSGYSSSESGVMCPVVNVSYDAIRGPYFGTQWPERASVDMESFIGKLREKTWLKRLDLPTEAQWEYACRAGTKTLFSVASPNLIVDDVGWFKNNSRRKVHPVGEKLPNAWGLYDMHGNVWEWCLDLSGGTLEGRDPVGPSADNNGWRYILGRRVLRGGCYYDSASKATSSYRGEDENTSDGSHYVGLRLFMIANE